MVDYINFGNLMKKSVTEKEPVVNSDNFSWVFKNYIFFFLYQF
jgi:hypothetical protein